MIEVPAAISLKDLHRIVQAAMGWEDEHVFEVLASNEARPETSRIVPKAGLNADGLIARSPQLATDPDTPTSVAKFRSSGLGGLDPDVILLPSLTRG
jgi:hypothetical protein